MTSTFGAMQDGSLGVRLRGLRAERRMSQVAMARILGLSVAYLNRVEQGRDTVTPAVVQKVRRALGVDLTEDPPAPAERTGA